MHILLTAATVYEVAPILDFLEKSGTKQSFSTYLIGEHQIELMISGVGSVACAFAMARIASLSKIDLAIQVGLAGAFDQNLNLGQAIIVSKDRFGDLGVEESDGSFTSIEELGLSDGSKFPFVDGWLQCGCHVSHLGTPQISGITVNCVTGTQRTKIQRQNNYNAGIETMEGAAFYYSCKMLDINNFQLRAISNYIEPRNRENWKIDTAIISLKNEFIRILPMLGADT
jgi:futalosine hydrolase